MATAEPLSPQMHRPPAGVPFARGYFEAITPLPREITLGPLRLPCPQRRPFGPPHGVQVRGWMLAADRPFHRFAAYVNGREFFTAQPLPRPDILGAFPHVPHADQAGFDFQIPSTVARKGVIELFGLHRGQPVARMVTPFRDDLHRKVPTPPPVLMARVAGTRDAVYFRAGGYKAFYELRAALERHRPLERVRRLLDWGCGCGRVTAHWLRLRRRPEVHGCDVDGGAVSWCRVKLRRGTFTTVRFQPPTPYPDGHFDAITGYSVFTHLDRFAQRDWLAEMRRVLAPGGVFVATVHGPSAAGWTFGPHTAQALRGGIHDATPDPGLDLVLGAGVYRSTFQTREYTDRVFGEYFDILEYVERGIGNNQDLVVLRRPAR